MGWKRKPARSCRNAGSATERIFSMLKNPEEVKQKRIAARHFDTFLAQMINTGAMNARNCPILSQFLKVTGDRCERGGPPVPRKAARLVANRMVSDRDCVSHMISWNRSRPAHASVQSVRTRHRNRPSRIANFTSSKINHFSDICQKPSHCSNQVDSSKRRAWRGPIFEHTTDTMNWDRPFWPGSPACFATSITASIPAFR